MLVSGILLIFFLNNSMILTTNEFAGEENPKVKTEKQPAKKLFPNSPLFQKWTVELSEEDQRNAEDLFQKYGYNVFLSDQIPLDRELPETRDHRCV